MHGKAPHSLQRTKSYIRVLHGATMNLKNNKVSSKCAAFTQKYWKYPPVPQSEAPPNKVSTFCTAHFQASWVFQKLALFFSTCWSDTRAERGGGKGLDSTCRGCSFCPSQTSSTFLLFFMHDCALPSGRFCLPMETDERLITPILPLVFHLCTIDHIYIYSSMYMSEIKQKTCRHVRNTARFLFTLHILSD